jgi:thioredoxin reductase (NADPH)
MTRTEVAVAGAGPIGLEIAVALKRAGIDYLQFDAKQIGQTISWFPPQTRFFSSNERIAIAGVPLQTFDQNKATREQYLAYLRGVVQQFDLQIKTYEPLAGVERRDGGFVLHTRAAGGPSHYWARRLILVTGGTDHPRRLNIAGEDLPHVSHYFQDAHTYFRKRLLVVGGKNSAVEAALRCHQAGAFVSISYRRAALPEKSIKYWLLPEIHSLIESGKMPVYFRTMPAEITPTTVRLADCDSLSASGRPNVSAASRTIAVDFVLLLTGYEQDNALLRLAGIELRGDCQAPLFNEQTMETNVPGLYVAGTAVGGTQDKYTVFIENCHVHVERIMAAITGTSAPAAPPQIAMPES